MKRSYIDFKKFSQINEDIKCYSKQEQIDFAKVSLVFISEILIHIIIFTALLMLSGINSIILAILFAMICGNVSFKAWYFNGYSLTGWVFIRLFKNNSKMMKILTYV